MREYLTDVLTRLPAMLQQDAAQLTPAKLETLTAATSPNAHRALARQQPFLFPEEETALLMARVERGQFVHSQLDRVGLPHATFTEEAINLITRSAEGTLRAVRNLCIGALIEAVRDRTKTVDLKQVYAILLQPHWRHNTSGEPTEPVLIPPRNLHPRS